MEEAINVMVAEDKLNGSTDMADFMGVVIENNRIALKNLAQLKELQNWVSESMKTYK